MWVREKNRAGRTRMKNALTLVPAGKAFIPQTSPPTFDAQPCQ